ncbi:MAG: hypothetical protein L0I15_04340, partial [Bifidobacterium mongoliense]|uniref:hypothetical protein n=1 Tax=Bifidobacterium mongoliense TaxID=518643 RepID=UPI00264A3188
NIPSFLIWGKSGTKPSPHREGCFEQRSKTVHHYLTNEKCHQKPQAITHDEYLEQLTTSVAIIM